jgi:hypothetical protein
VCSSSCLTVKRRETTDIFAADRSGLTYTYTYIRHEKADRIGTASY